MGLPPLRLHTLKSTQHRRPFWWRSRTYGVLLPWSHSRVSHPVLIPWLQCSDDSTVHSMQSQHVETLILPALVCVGSSNAIACPTPSTRLRTLPECVPARRSCIPPEHERRPLCRRDRGIRAPRCMVAPRRLPAGRWPPMASRPLYSARAAASRRTRSAEQNVHTCMHVTPDSCACIFVYVRTY